MRLPLLLLALPLSLTLAACADPGKDKTTAKVTEPAPTPEAPKPAPAAPAGAKLALSGSVGFTGAKVTDKHVGAFTQWTGSATVDGTEVTGLEFTVQTASVSVEPEKLQNHLKSPDFFDVAQFPTATFVSRAVKAGAPADSKLAGATHTVEGDFTLHGVTKTLTVPAIITVTPDSVMAKSEFAINRKDFGIVYPGKPDDLIADAVAINVDTIANRAAAPIAPAAPAPAAPAAAAPAPAAPAAPAAAH